MFDISLCEPSSMFIYTQMLCNYTLKIQTFSRTIQVHRAGGGGLLGLCKILNYQHLATSKEGVLLLLLAGSFQGSCLGKVVPGVNSSEGACCVDGAFTQWTRQGWAAPWARHGELYVLLPGTFEKLI